MGVGLPQPSQILDAQLVFDALCFFDPDTKSVNLFASSMRLYLLSPPPCRSVDPS